MPETEQPITKENAAYQSIRTAIIEGTLSPGSRVSIRELAARFNFGRTPISDAMKRLIAEGWLESAPGVGTRVASLDLGDRYEYMQVRGAIEVLAARLCAERISPEAALELDHTLAVAQLAIRQQNWLRAIESDISFHRLCAKLCGNHFLAIFYDRLLTQDQRVFFRNLPDPDARIQSHEQHAAIVDAIKAGDAEGAARAAQFHTDTILHRLQNEQHPVPLSTQE